MDRYLSNGSTDGLEVIINRISENTGYHDCATLSLVHIPENPSRNSPNEAVVYLAGDTMLFHGNLFRKTLNQIEGNPQFLGTTHAYFEPKYIPLEQGDYFIIASDGILSLLSHNPEENIAVLLLKYLSSKLDEFVCRVVEQCNAYFKQYANGNEVPRFGGTDNVTVVMVRPDDLADTKSPETFLLGGYTKI
jgi:hypothetical protein